MMDGNMIALDAGYTVSGQRAGGYNTGVFQHRQQAVLELMANQYDPQRSAVGSLTHWDPEVEIDIKAKTAPGVAGGIGLDAGPDGCITIAGLRARENRQSKWEKYPDEIQAKLEAAEQRLADGESVESVGPLDAT